MHSLICGVQNGGGRRDWHVVPLLEKFLTPRPVRIRRHSDRGRGWKMYREQEREEREERKE
jgi:hypothetical protein